jgi:hypothetical protein
VNKLKEIHESIVNGAISQAMRQIDEYGFYDFYDAYEAYLINFEPQFKAKEDLLYACKLIFHHRNIKITLEK